MVELGGSVVRVELAVVAPAAVALLELTVGGCGSALGTAALGDTEAGGSVGDSDGDGCG